MYDEFERAAGARPRPGLTLLGWVGVALAIFALIGATGAWFAYRFVSERVHEVAERFETGTSAEMAPLVARTVARTLGELGTAPAMDPDDLTAAVARALAAPAGQRSAGGDDVEGFLRIRTGEGAFTADLRAGDDGGALVVRDVDGEVIVDLSADARGGRLFVRGEGEVARIEAGEDAAGPPRWVPEIDDDAVDYRHVVSGHAGEGTFGAVTWSSSRSPQRLVDRVREQLEDDGWDVRAEHRLDGRDAASASVLAHRPESGRTVLFSATSEAGSTRVVLGWGQGDGA